MDNPVLKSNDPAAAAQLPLWRIQEINSEPTMNVYTDASRDDSGATGWAMTVPQLQYHSIGRLPDNTPITQAELIAVWKALQWNSRRTEGPQRLAIHTDSWAAHPGQEHFDLPGDCF